MRIEGTMTTDIQALYARIVGAERPCPPTGTGPNGACTTCGGSGIVAVFPGLRGPGNHDHPKPLSFDVLSTALREAGWGYHIDREEDANLVEAMVWHGNQGSGRSACVSDTEALVLAVARALGVGEGGRP